MTLGGVSAPGSTAGSCFCSCCGAKMTPYFSDHGVVSHSQIHHLINESFLTVKGAALFLPRGSSPTPSSTPNISQRRDKHTGDLQQHLQTMFTVLRPEDTIRLAVRLESAYPQCTRYMVVVSTNGRQDTEESIVLGMDFTSSDSCCKVGLVLPLWSDTLIHLDGDGGFSVSTVNRVHVFKPVSVQAMWSALQSLHKACEVARCFNYYPGSLFLTWVSYYQSRISSDQHCINEWNAMQDVQSHRADSPVLFTDVPTERERTERLIKMRLREIMMQKDLENVTSKEIRTELEMQMVCNLREFKEFIDNEMIVILGQMDSPTEIFDHVYLGSEWNASNLDELQNSGVRYILNVTREIDNFFPGMFEYHNIRVYDEEATNLLEYWNETYKFITKAKKAGAKCLVHCKMGVSRSASTVIAYAMKEYGWDLETAFDHVKERRAITKPNPSFMRQLEEYQGILLASKQRHNKLWRSHSDSDLSDRPEPLCKPTSHILDRSDHQNNNNNASSPSLHHFLGLAMLQALGTESQSSDLHSISTTTTNTSDSHILSNSVCDSTSEQADSISVQQDSLPLPLPRPRAATLLSEERMDISPRVAVTLPAAVPHPPPSFHILSPSPERQGVPSELTLDLPKWSSSEETFPIALESSESDTQEHSSSDSASNLVSPFSPRTSIMVTLVAPVGPSDDNNNPSELETGSVYDCRGEADGSSNHSTDSIDFFSAREKFLGLSKDGRTSTLTEQAQQRMTMSLALEDPQETTKEREERVKMMCESSLSFEDHVDKASPDKSHHPHDNGISVRHIITEIESISNPASSLTTPSSSSSSVPASSRSPHSTRQDLQEDRETGEITHSSLTPSSYPQSPSTPPCEWPFGSVRRATKQLEQRLRQELETVAPNSSQRSPLHSPSIEQPLIQSPLFSPNMVSPPVHSPLHCTEQALPFRHTFTQGESMATSAVVKPKECELQILNSSGIHTLQDTLHSPDSNISQDPDAVPDTVCPFTGNHTVTHTHTPSGLGAITCPSAIQSSNTKPQTKSQSQAQSQNQVPIQPNPEPLIHTQSELKAQPQASSNQIELVGGTCQESDTDESPASAFQGKLLDCAPSCKVQSKLVHSSQELDRIQQTLRELQAFLHEAGDLETGETLEQLDISDLSQPKGPGQILLSREAMDTDSGLGKEEAVSEPGQEKQSRERQGKSLREAAGRQWAMELEARLRQAGLTPPSLMKRSASLAKLDCLELSANDLSVWELTLHATALSSNHQAPRCVSPTHPCSGPDDVWKKQRVLDQNPHANNISWSHGGRGYDHSSSSPASLSVSSAHLQHWQEDTEEKQEPMAGSGCAVVLTTPRQQVRGHLSRRPRKVSAEKKQRIVTVLYNTM